MNQVFECHKNAKNSLAICQKAIESINQVFRTKKSFAVTISDVKRSKPQLRAYWVLVRAVKKWMQEQGNVYSENEVSDFLKIQAGFYSEIAGQKIAKSISNKSNITVLEMEQLINYILQFGAEMQIQDCIIKNKDLEEMLNYFRQDNDK